MLDNINIFIFGFLSCLLLFEPIVINFIYLSNIDLFLDLILFNNIRTKFIKYVLYHYYLNSNDDIVYSKIELKEGVLRHPPKE